MTMTDKINEKRLFLLDAYALIFRAYYALINVPRITQGGFNTSAVFGFVNTLEELLRKEKPTHIAVCFDPQGPTFRHKALESYKGERQATPEDIRLSIPIIKEILKAYNIPVVEVAGYEADDVIGTLARRAEGEGFTTYMMTPDKDFGQLVTTSVLQYKPAYRGGDFELRGREEVCRRYDISSPAQVIDLLALMGDKIDNIPGCPGVGEKTAVKLIAQFGSVEELLKRTDELKGALKRKVEENRELIELSYYLATIRTDVPVDIDPASLERRSPDREKLFAIFKEMEFRQLSARVAKRLDAEEGKSGSESPETAPENQPASDTIAGLEEAPVELAKMECGLKRPAGAMEVQEAFDAINGCGEVGLYLYAQGESDFTATLRGIAVATDQGNAYVFEPSQSDTMARVLDLLARPDILKVTTGAKRAYVVASNLRNDSLPALACYYDVELAHYLLEPELRHDTDTLAATYLHLELVPLAKAPARKAASGLFAELEQEPLTEEEAERCAQEACATLMLRQPLQEEIERQGMKDLLYDIELPASRVLAEMELTGVRLDVKALNEAAKTLQERLQNIESEIYASVGEEFNIGSPSKVGEILFDKLRLDDKAKKTKSGQYSTGEAVLEKLTDKHPVVSMIMEHRQLKKLINTWLTALPEAINPVTGRVHTNYNQTVTATGRLSSSNPNLQNIPVRDDLGREIRRAFIADEGCVFLSADYSQIELRLVADFADDETMIDAFNHGKDIHAITASKIYGTAPEEVTAAQRRNAKTANFGILYGISAFGLASRLRIPRAEAKMLIDGYNATFPKVHKFMGDTVEFARAHGYVGTIKGRKRRQPDINSRNAVVRGYAERNAINAPIQGSAADIIKSAMVAIDAEMAARKLKSKMIMQVHDELNFNVPADEVDIMKELVVRNMEAAYHGKVCLEAACGTGPDWLTAH